MVKKVLRFLPVPLIVLFFITAVIMANTGFVSQRQVFLFPLDNNKGINAELRLITKYNDKEERIVHTVRELLLGPSILEFERVVPAGTKIQSQILDGNKLYLDFSEAFFDQESGLTLPFQERVALVERNIHLNYRFIKDVVITINGQIPESPFFSLE